MTIVISRRLCRVLKRQVAAVFWNWPGLLLSLLVAPSLAAAQTKAPASYDPGFVEQILQRLEVQERELKELRAAQGKAPPASGIAAVTPAAAATVAVPAALEEALKPERYPRLSFHGFGDITYGWDNAKAGHRNSFALGQLDFFVTSQLAENLSVLSETVVEADARNNFVVELERLLLQWRPSEYFNLDVGRYHTAVGYYNTAYHHGTWFQTAVGRPGFLDFEDGGGVIPAHNVGVSARGRLPVGSLGLSYVVEIGNGRPYRDPAAGFSPVLSISDNNDFKALNFALTARPEAWPGVQFGVGAYFDRLTLDARPRTDELLLHAHAVYLAGPWEFLSEGYYIRHAPQGGNVATSPAAFAQLARKFGRFTPYARFAYANVSDNDPVWLVIGANGLRYGPGIGLRWDFSSVAALKAQFDFQKRRGLSDLSTLTLQACFTF